MWASFFAVMYGVRKLATWTLNTYGDSGFLVWTAVCFSIAFYVSGCSTHETNWLT
jgi:hypothetical protein